MKATAGEAGRVGTDDTKTLAALLRERSDAQ
jgi:hypothetical protein